MLLISYNFLIGESQARVASWRNNSDRGMTEEVDNNSMIAQRKIIVSVMGKKHSKELIECR